jgi:hypothetical protein
MALTLFGDFSDFEFAQKLAEEWNEGPQVDEIELQKQHDQILTYAASPRLLRGGFVV